ncbi:MAG: hypothetical protein KGL39_47025 [Patescibacteria group bacterium]|nr:hypothetical protein [Patescibacteria group bacterium]
MLMLYGAYMVQCVFVPVPRMDMVLMPVNEVRRLLRMQRRPMVYELKAVNGSMAGVTLLMR